MLARLRSVTGISPNGQVSLRCRSRIQYIRVLRRCDPLLLASRTRLLTLMLARPVRASLATAPAASSRASGPRAALASPDPRRVPRSRPRLGARPGVDVRAIDRVSTLRVRERAARGAARRGATAMSAAAASASAADGPLFLGLDFGTSGARCVAVDARGDAVAETSAKYPPIVDGGMGGGRRPHGRLGGGLARRALVPARPALGNDTRARGVHSGRRHFGNRAHRARLRGSPGPHTRVPPMLQATRGATTPSPPWRRSRRRGTPRAAPARRCASCSWWFETDGGRVASRWARARTRRSPGTERPRVRPASAAPRGLGGVFAARRDGRDGPQQRVEAGVRSRTAWRRRRSFGGVPGLDLNAAVRQHAPHDVPGAGHRRRRVRHRGGQEALPQRRRRPRRRRHHRLGGGVRGGAVHRPRGLRDVAGLEPGAEAGERDARGRRRRGRVLAQALRPMAGGRRQQPRGLASALQLHRRRARFAHRGGK